MYELCVKRDFVAQHFLIGGDWGDENEWHSHHFQVEIILQGSQLDKHGYLVDIVDIEKQLDAQVAYFKDKTLNDLEEFAGLNPSVEHFARIFCMRMAERIQAPTLDGLTLRLWENDIAWASYSHQIT